MNFWRSLNGVVRVELTSADPAGALSAVVENNIPVYRVLQKNELTQVLDISRRDYGRIRRITEKRGEELSIKARSGLYWSARNLANRPVLIIGALLLLLLAALLPTRILFVRVEGNSTVPTRLILEQAEQCGIMLGASRREVRSEKVKNELLARIPELQWTGINTAGCVATISVQERTMEEQKENPTGVRSIVAVRDGIITECTVRRGNALCTPGQAVRAGQTLVSGYTDCGLAIRAECADADIFAETSRHLRVYAPAEYANFEKSTGQKKKISLVIGKNRIILFEDSGILGASCGKMVSSYSLTLPGGFVLPVIFVREDYILREQETGSLFEDIPEESLIRNAKTYLSGQMVAGRILDSVTAVSASGGFYLLEGEFTCEEMIGQVKGEEILEKHEQNYGTNG